MTQERAKVQSFRYPTPEEMLALDRAARRADAPRTRSQLPTQRKTMTTLFWRNALASLPPSVQRRYASTFEAAERFEAMLDLGIEVSRFAKDAIAKTYEVAAHAMRRTARTLDRAEHRAESV